MTEFSPARATVVSLTLAGVLIAGASAGIGWALHPDGIQQRHFSGRVKAVNSDQSAIGVRTTAYGDVGGALVVHGPPVKSGQWVTGILYGEDAQIIEVFQEP
ncbi:hypothetical protein H5V45_19645 [Nocardioides sp. KIGAM211]|uniref:Uncharacterized protein n=1 Tax=Nocardioides luti TaxID=2761101 RepID=A0A7X0RJN6_9ACTN|nr:hypothetical protein [Nocardioides luti]MBB6629544.1 hypothetical protein [Nocardioides luti]